MTEKKMIVYGHDFCAQARSLVRLLRKHAVDFEYRDVVRGDPHWQKELKKLANGNLSVPTIIFPNGDVFVEPWNPQVLAALGIHEPNWLERLTRWVKKQADSSED